MITVHWFLYVLLFLIAAFIIRLERVNYNKLKEKYKLDLEKAGKEAIKKSKEVIRGKISEELIPLFNDFPYTLSDVKFSGQPIDYVVFNGMSTIRDGNDCDIEVVFADVKTGNARLSTVQREIRRAINDKRVRFETWEIKDNKLTIKQ